MTKPRVLVVDDSAFARKALREMLAGAGDLDVVGFARDGLDALEKIAELEPDVVTLDLSMPALDGVGVLKALAERDEAPRVVVVTMADDQSEIGVAALANGAFDVVHKPTALATDRLYEVGAELVERVRAAAALGRGRRGDERDRAVERPVSADLAGDQRPAFDVVVVGASTGGPQAVSQVLAAMPASFAAPMAIVVHMPPGYTAAFADRLDRSSALDVVEAREEMSLMAGRVAIARAGIHLRLARSRVGALTTTLDIAPADAVHRPSVDVLFESAARAVGPRVLGVVMTGMGDDGLAGARAIRAAGGHVIVEAETSCVVYGMPRAVAAAGLANEHVPLRRMASAIVDAVTGIPAESTARRR